MALATRPKPPAHTKKRQAQHHRQSKHYLKAYWPYLPMLSTVGLGLLVNRFWGQATVSSGSLNAQAFLPGQHLARIQVLTHSSAVWSLAAVSTLAALGLVVFIARHSLHFHRFVTQGEALVSRHPFLDIAIVFAFTVAFVLAQPGGVIV